MSISISSGKVLQNLYSNSNGKTSYYTGIKTEEKVKINEEVESSLSINTNFKKALRGLRGCDYSTGLKAEIKKYAKDLVDTYNEFAANKGNGSKEYSRKLNQLTSVMEDYSTELSKAGITLSGGKLKFDTDTFDDADISDLKAIFTSDSDFIDTVDLKLNSLSKMIKNDINYTVKEDNYIFNQINSNNIPIADSTNKLAVSVEKLLGTPLLEDESNEAEILTMLTEYLQQLNDFYSQIDDNAEYSQKAVDDIYSIDALNNQLFAGIDENPFPYEELFDSGNPASYARQILPLYQNLFSELVSASAKNFTISSFVDYQV